MSTRFRLLISLAVVGLITAVALLLALPGGPLRAQLGGGPQPPGTPLPEVGPIITPGPPPTPFLVTPPSTTPAPLSPETPPPPPVALPPNSTWITYTDPDLGFSFQYPDNWFINASGLSKDGAKDVIVQNYARVIGGFTPTPDHIGIEIVVFVGELPPSRSLREYVAAGGGRGFQLSGTVLSQEEITVGSLPALKVLSQHPLEDGSLGTVLDVFIRNGNDLYVWLTSPDRTYLAAFDSMFQSFRPGPPRP